LKTKIAALERAKQEEEKARIRGEYSSAEWGSQIRSYVLHPYKLVKDHRTKFETKRAEDVLEGNVGPFMEAYLRYNARCKK